MSEQRDHLLFLQDHSSLTPSDAVAAIIVGEGGRYLLQHRDAIGGIFYPDHWSCFGGAVDAGESVREALVRELFEELRLEVQPEELAYFTRFSFDFGFAGGKLVTRDYFVLQQNERRLEGVTLGEGQAVGLFEPPEMLASRRVAPYDAYALWMHVNAERLSPHATTHSNAGR